MSTDLGKPSAPWGLMCGGIRSPPSTDKAGNRMLSGEEAVMGNTMGTSLTFRDSQIYEFE